MSIYVGEGPDNRGKTTTLKFLANLLGAPYIKFPYGSDNDAESYSGKQIRAILNDKENPCNPVAFQALQLINKLEAIEVIRELERKHGIVFVDRWSLSAVIYGSVDGVDEEWNRKICKMFDDQITPTILFVFTGLPFTTDDDIYGEKQEEITKLYDNFCISQINNTDVVEINVSIDNERHKTVEQIALEMLGYITRRELNIKTSLGACWIKLGVK